MAADLRSGRDEITVHASYDYSAANTLRWAKALAILARIRRRTASQHEEGGSL